MELPWTEEEALRHSYPAYDAWEQAAPKQEDYPEQDYDPFAEAEAIWEMENER